MNKKNFNTFKIPTEETCRNILDKILQNIVHRKKQTGCEGFLVAASGGVLSSLTMALGKLASISGKPSKDMAIFMPAATTATESYDLAYMAAEKTGFSIQTIPVKFMVSTIKTALRENFMALLEETTANQVQSLRNIILGSFAIQKNLLVLHSTTKSDILTANIPSSIPPENLCYPLGGIYRSEIRNLATYVSGKFDNIIPEEIISRPSLTESVNDESPDDLLKNQKDLDTVLTLIHDQKKDRDEITSLGIQSDIIDKVYKLNAF